VAALVVGLVAARMRINALLIQPFVLLAGAFVVVAAVQNYADGATVSDRLTDFSDRMREWWAIVRSGDISNDNLPFVLLVHSATFLAAYFGAWSIYRWHNPWIALVPGGFVLLSTISFMEGKPGGPLFFFLVGSLFIVARAHLQKSQARWQAEGVEYPDWISLNALNLTFLVSLLLLVVAWQLPIAREAGAAQSLVSAVTKPFEPLNQHAIRLFHNINGASGGNFHNFGDSLPIRGEVSLGSKALYEVNSGEAGYIRGTSYDEYTGVGWKSTERDDQNVDAGQQALETYAERTTTILRVTVADQASTVLTLGTALGTNLDSVTDFDSTNPADVERVTSRRSLDPGDTYNSVGSRSTASADQLRAAGTVYPDWVTSKYLQLPADLPDRVRVEAARVTNGAETPYDIAFLTQRYLRSFPYDLSVPAAPPGRDAVDYLLFDLRRGYFDPLSTAMCVMVRTQGVPCRVAVGYGLDPSDAEETSYTVRKNDAYAWVEVWFPTYGWVEFNPTSDRPAGGAGPGTGLEGQ
ncbi:MAG: transglutaminase domain-containing protein, partial [Dehalococcoidia bacterium]